MSVASTKACLHCRLAPAYAFRGLCYTCYRVKSIRSRYSPEKAVNPRSVLDFQGEAPAPPPTNALAGTEEKLKVLEERAMRGLSLFSEEDVGAGSANTPAQQVDYSREYRMVLRGGGRRVC